MQVLRILLLAELNNPESISVPLVGYFHSTALARMHAVTLITHRDNLEALQRQEPGYREIIPISRGFLDRVFDWCFRVVFRGDFGSQALTAFRIPFYLCFEYLAWRSVRHSVRAGKYDVVLRLTPVSPAIPSLWPWLMRKLATPFVLGPINGGLPWPQGLSQSERQREWISPWRSFYRYVPFSRSCYRYAKAIIVGSTATLAEYRGFGDKVFFLPENGIEVHQTERPRLVRDSDRLQLVFVGRLVPYKACDLVLKSSAPLLATRRAHLRIIGDGPERAQLEALASALGVREYVEFCGHRTHDEVLAFLRASDVLVFPSVREFGGGVVYEALASGVVPLVCDYGGPGDVVSRDLGYKVALSSEAGMRDEMTRAPTESASDPLRLSALSTAARTFAREHLSWDAKAKHMSSILTWAMGRGEDPQHLRRSKVGSVFP